MKLENITNISICHEVQLKQTLAAMKFSRTKIEFGHNVIITDADYSDSSIEVINIGSKIDLSLYNKLCIENLHEFFKTDFCLISQWDGFVIDANRWNDNFLNYDYIGAPWGYEIEQPIGNGGFSLRSRKFVEVSKEFIYTPNQSKWLSANQEKCFKVVPEDWFLCYNKLEDLKKEGVKFPSRELALKFSVEHPSQKQPFNRDDVKTYKSFGFHGDFNTGGMNLIK